MEGCVTGWWRATGTEFLELCDVPLWISLCACVFSVGGRVVGVCGVGARSSLTGFKLIISSSHLSNIRYQNPSLAVSL